MTPVKQVLTLAVLSSTIALSAQSMSQADRDLKGRSRARSHDAETSRNAPGIEVSQ